jgi:hypothetical protein
MVTAPIRQQSAPSAMGEATARTEESRSEPTLAVNGASLRIGGFMEVTHGDLGAR